MHGLEKWKPTSSRKRRIIKKALRLRYQHLDDEIRAQRLSQRYVLLTCSCDCEPDLLCEELIYLSGVSKKPIHIIMNSPGGEVYDGLQIYNAIRSVVRSGVPIIIEVTGLCASMATVILQAGSTRIAHKGTRFLLHEVSELKLFSKETATEKAEHAAELQKVNVTLAEIIAEQVHKPVETVLNGIKKKELWMSAEEAKQWGLVDKVV